MNNLEKSLLAYFSEEELNKIQSVKIGIAGAGGVGSNCAMCLVRSGFRKLKIIDFDRVEFSNLNRQFYFVDQVGTDKVAALAENLRMINPEAEVEAILDKLDAANLVSYFADCEIVVEALDQAEDKSVLVEKLLSSKKLIVGASGMAGINNSDKIKIHRVKENLILVGDLESEVFGMQKAYAPKVSIVAAKQAEAVLKFILKN